MFMISLKRRGSGAGCPAEKGRNARPPHARLILAVLEELRVCLVLVAHHLSAGEAAHRNDHSERHREAAATLARQQSKTAASREKEHTSEWNGLNMTGEPEALHFGVHTGLMLGCHCRFLRAFAR